MLDGIALRRAWPKPRYLQWMYFDWRNPWRIRGREIRRAIRTGTLSDHRTESKDPTIRGLSSETRTSQLTASSTAY